MAVLRGFCAALLQIAPSFDSPMSKVCLTGNGVAARDVGTRLPLRLILIGSLQYSEILIDFFWFLSISISGKDIPGMRALKALL